jgi:hypothetical protein
MNDVIASASLSGDNDDRSVGGVVGVDVWRREVREWCEENVHREDVTPLITLRDQERTHGIHYRLPCSDAEFDGNLCAFLLHHIYCCLFLMSFGCVLVVFVPFLASHSFCNQRGDSEEGRRIKLQMMISVCSIALTFINQLPFVTDWLVDLGCCRNIIEY